MKQLRFNLVTAASLLLFIATAYLFCRSWIVRDEVSIARRTLFIAAADSGRFEIASATCSVGIPTSTPFASNLVKGAPTIFAPTLQARHRSMMPGGNRGITLNHVGIESSGYNYYGSLEYGGDTEFGAAPLVIDNFAITIPIALLLCIFAVAPAIWMWKRWQRRHPLVSLYEIPTTRSRTE